MSVYFEIAYAALNSRLCLFTGTGFSKAISEGAAPTWQGLLEQLCDQCPNPNKIKNALFPKDGKNPLSLEESAQVLQMELLKNDKNIYEEISTIVSKVEIGGKIDNIREFCTTQRVKFVTTNYDKLTEQLCGDQDCQSLTPGLPIPRSSARVRVYHVHGSTDAPENMVVTADDYFKFINGESYFSRKLSTVLHENTVLILGYSLGDTNLKAILSDYKGFIRRHAVGSNIFFVSRSAVSQHIKDYYSNCYGIRVIDEIDLDKFFKFVIRALPLAEKCAESTISNIRKVVFNNHHFTNKYLKLEESFYEIVSSISAIGRSINDSRVVEVLGDIIQKKSALSSHSGAWEQYNHLANWIIYLVSILDVKDTSIESTFLDAVQKSMESMSKDMRLGYSWQSYRSWNSKWDNLTPGNRALIKKHIIASSTWGDAISIVNLG